MRIADAIAMPAAAAIAPITSAVLRLPSFNDPPFQVLPARSLYLVALVAVVAGIVQRLEDATHKCNQLHGVERLRQVAVDARLPAAKYVGILGLRSEHDHRDVARVRILLQ